MKRIRFPAVTAALRKWFLCVIATLAIVAASACDDEKVCIEQEQVTITVEPVGMPIDKCTLVQGALEAREMFDFDTDGYTIAPDKPMNVTVTLTERDKDTCPSDIDFTLYVNGKTVEDEASLTEGGCPQLSVRLYERRETVEATNSVLVRGAPSRAFEYDIHLEYEE